MKKRLLFALTAPLLLVGCNSANGSNENNKTNIKSYQDWLLSDDAEDFDGNRKINEADYQIYVSVINWKLSGEGSDLNGDGKVDAKDYLLSTQSTISFNEWIISSAAFDFDGNRVIDNADFDYYLTFLGDVGTYKFTTLQMIDSNNFSFVSDNSLTSTEIVEILKRSDVVITEKGQVKFNFIEEDRARLENCSEEIDETINSLKFKKISESAIELNATISVSGIPTNVSFYMSKSISSNYGYSGNINFESGEVKVHVYAALEKK